MDQSKITCEEGSYVKSTSFGCGAFGDANHVMGYNSFAFGQKNRTEGNYSIAIGKNNIARSVHSIALGTRSVAEADALTWNYDTENDYYSHGNGTFNINPKDGISGFYIGDQSLDALYWQKNETSSASEILNALTSKADVSSIPLSTSQLINDSGYLTAYQSLSNYYQKSETSSANEISGEFKKYQPSGDYLSSTDISAEILLDSGEHIATLSVGQQEYPIYAPTGRYKLRDIQLQDTGDGLSCAIEDRTIATIEISSSSNDVSVYLPPKADDGARDFILRVEISS